MRRQKFMHFSHHHPLHATNVKEEDAAVCSCCSLGITGQGFRCNHQAECGFLLHKSCAEIPQHIRHRSHPPHVLTLVSGREFFCNACCGAGSGFTYNCSACDYDIHVKCSSLPETVKRDEHEHPLTLQYTMVQDSNDVEFVCDACERFLKHGCWVYHCRECDFGTHLDCSIVESKETSDHKENKKQEHHETPTGPSPTPTGPIPGSYDPVALMNAQIRAQERLQLNQMEMQTSFLDAQRQRDHRKFMLNLI